MHKTKELLKEIRISSNAGGSKLSPTPSARETTNTRKKKVRPHPPIETNWLLPPVGEREKPYRSFMSFLSFRRSQSSEMVLEGRHNPKDEKLVESFRELLFLEGHLPVKHYDYHTLLSTLSGVRNLASTQSEFKFEEHEEVKRCYPHGYHGVDRYGRPVYIERLGMVDLDSFLLVTTIDRFVKYHICEQEKTLNWRYPACSLAAKKHIASTLSILDVKNVGMSRFSKPARHLFMEIQKIDSNYYPETLHQLYIVNAGSGFKVLWKAIRAFLDARTLAKIRGVSCTSDVAAFPAMEAFIFLLMLELLSKNLGLGIPILEIHQNRLRFSLPSLNCCALKRKQDLKGFCFFLLGNASAPR
ncbi:Phosphatidylinositol/phosphatidylcholine transfer protein SFH11 [Sesamum angolense]|uniref:Phosphatidylinositol/phosphatidylcholine transfer protein SFH11 n=1 Tax=Sesamum angolense TaxID=2727404 RepID=A0AAE1WA56_9LAMI|nr:Phosphatidylinositol/phosphatidylcholine transfer protein SFH11 [Sesamum angolense]